MKLPTNYNALHWTEKRKAREEYVSIQNGKCCHCNGLLSERPSDDMMRKKINKSLFPSGFFKYPVHLHHDHNTEMTIGAVHNRCNAVLWQYHGE